MDVCESEHGLRKHRAVGSPRPPWSAAEKNNAVTPRRSRTKEVSSRYKSPSPATSSSSRRRCSSPNPTRTTPASSQLLPKRAQSAGRKRPSTPPSPPNPSTPVHESSVDGQLSSRRIAGSRLQESLWPSTMRSLSVSFQSDTISKPVSKKEKAIINVSDRTLRPTSNLAHKQVETPTTIRKPTPERKRSPLKGKNVSDQSENSKPVDSLHSRLIDQHRWPSTIGGKVSSNALNRSVEFSDKAIRTLKTSVPETGRSSMRRLSLPNEVRSSMRRLSLPNEVRSSMRRLSLPNEVSKPLQKSSSDTARLLTVDDSLLQVVRPHKFASASSLDKIGLVTPAVKSQTLSTSGSRPPSPSKTLGLSPFSSKGVSPSRSRPSSPPSRGLSPSRIRPINSSSQSNSSISVLSFIADFKRGKRGAAYIEDAHQLRLLYNRLLQWRFANARAEAVLYIQNATLEKTLYNVWNTTLSLWDSVIRKRINLQQLKLELKLNSVLNDQMAYLNDWALLESDHVDALAGAVEDLKAGTLRLPVTGGAKADIEHLKVAICSAVDVMQAMGSAICSLLSRVEGMNNLVSELAVVAAQEKAMLDESEALLASAAAMQVKDSICGKLTEKDEAMNGFRRLLLRHRKLQVLVSTSDLIGNSYPCPFMCNIEPPDFGLD